jgi:ubiquinone/menaquinone biosynthesis C-methylase UbiE
MSTINQDFVVAERERIRREYRRRDREVDSQLYALSQAAARFMIETRNEAAGDMLRRQSMFPRSNDRCLEVGFGAIGWLAELVKWGVCEANLCGIELDEKRAQTARELLPAADLRTGDAVALPWSAESFQLVIASTLFTSVLDSRVRQLIAGEVFRVLAPGGALLWYDFAYNNPRNRNVRGISRSEIKRLFPTLTGEIRTVTLAPPLARMIAPRSWTLATILERIPFLRTHLLAVLIKH